jgi:hydrogenase large subunit
VSTRITIDPITRIEGHLRVDVELEGNTVRSAWVSATMFRGLENILRGRDAREAWTIVQRICGVCTTVHAIASVRAVEDALQLPIPPNAQLIRNLILIHHALRDHAVHFYQLSALDWIDVQQAARANPMRAAQLAERHSAWTNNSAEQMRNARDRMARTQASGQMGLFANGYWGHPAMNIAPEASLVVLAHYMQAFEFQRKASQVVAMLGGKTPHIQNLTVGGVANAISLDGEGAFGMEQLEAMQSLIGEVGGFIREVYFPDACLIAGSYPAWFDQGHGADRLLALPELPRDAAGREFDLPGGTLHRSSVNRAVVPHSRNAFLKSVSEDTVRSYYKGKEALHPWKGETIPELTEWNAEGKYSWVKAARYNGEVAEVGPLASVLAGYSEGHALTRKWTDLALARTSEVAGHLITLDQLPSTMGRHLARAIRAAVLSELAIEHGRLLMDNIARGDVATHNPPTFPAGEISGVGLHEAPRGALSHWVVIEKGNIRNYQAVVPSTWNASPRDGNGTPGPYEAALTGLHVADAERPLEVLRTLHAFDPCMACACHAFDEQGLEISAVNVL